MSVDTINMSEEDATTAVENADTETPEVQADEVVENAAESKPTKEADGESASEPEKPKKVDPRQRKIAELSYRERELKRQNAQLMRNNEELSKAVSTTKESKAPKIEDFDTIDDYVDAKLDYHDNQRKPAETVEQNDYSNHDDLYEIGMEKYEDFADIVGAENVRITPGMAEAIFSIDDNDLRIDTAYYLGTNTKESARIAKLSPVRQIGEIAKLEAKLSSKAKTQKRPSNAPAPIKPVGGSKTTNDGYVEGESFESFLKKRNKQLGR